MSLKVLWKASSPFNEFYICHGEGFNVLGDLKTLEKYCQ